MCEEMQDVRVPLGKILLCVRQMNQAFNKEMVSFTVRGVKDRTLFRLELHRLSSYGSLVRYSENQIEHLIKLLFDNGALNETTGRYKSLKLGKPSIALLQQEEPILTKLPKKLKH